MSSAKNQQSAKKSPEVAPNDGESKLDPKLRFLQLLSPKTREKRWELTSWHHHGEFRRLPDGTVWTDRTGSALYQDPPQSTILPTNRTSFYLNTQQQSTDFLIHPDWV